MPTIKSETWDGVTAPAIPTGWTVDSQLVTATTNSPTSAPNSLIYPAASANPSAACYATWATADSNGGDVQVSATVRFSNVLAEQDVWLFCRANQVAASANSATLSDYHCGIARAGASPGFFLSKNVSGTGTTLGRVAAAPFADAINYRVVLLCRGTAISAQCQRLSDGFWLTSGGSFVSDPSGATVAISVTDSSVTGAGYAGAAFYLVGTTGGAVGVDDWLLETPPRAAATFYVSPTGSDANSGTSTAAPWQTIAKVNSTPLVGGDAVLFQGGQTHSGNLLIQNSGTAAAPILVSSYGTGAATINPGTGTGIQLKDCAYVRLSNLAVAGPGVSVSGSASSTTSTGVGLQILSTATQAAITSWLHGIHCDNLSISGLYWGVTVSAPNGSSSSGPYPVGYDDVSLTNCTIQECLRAGLSIYGADGENGGAGNTTPYHKNFYIGSCVVRNIYGDSGYTASYSGAGILILNVDTCLVERCLVTNCAQASGANTPAGGGPCAFILYAATNCTIQYCEASFQHNPHGSDAIGFDIDGGSRQCTVQYSYSHDNDGSGLLIYDGGGSGPTQDNTFRYNISQNDARAIDMPVRQGAAPGSCIFHNNTIVSTAPGGSPSLIGNFTSAGSAFYNNIFWCGAGVGLLSNVSAATFAGNLYWLHGASFSLVYNGVTYTSLAAFQAVQETVGGVPTGVFADPALVAPGTGGTLLPATPVAALTAYTLGASSPAIDAGLDLRVLFGIDPGLLDVKGLPNRAGGGYDIGACEHGASALVGSGSGLRRVNLAGGIGG